MSGKMETLMVAILTKFRRQMVELYENVSFKVTATLTYLLDHNRVWGMEDLDYQVGAYFKALDRTLGGSLEIGRIFLPRRHIDSLWRFLRT